MCVYIYNNNNKIIYVNIIATRRDYICKVQTEMHPLVKECCRVVFKY